MKKLLLLSLFCLLLSSPVSAAKLEPVSITANGAVLLTTIKRQSAPDLSKLTVYATGTWGSGTLKLQWSPDKGATKFDLKDKVYSVPTLSANGYIPGIEFTKPNMTSTVQLYAVLTGATDPDLSIGVIDNN